MWTSTTRLHARRLATRTIFARFGYKRSCAGRSASSVRLPSHQLHLAVDRHLRALFPRPDDHRRRLLRSWPIVAGQFIIALTFAELSSHYPVAGSVLPVTKYLSGKTYSWFAG